MRAVLFFSLIIFAHISFAASNKFHVIIDPGHGGIDSGAVRGKLRESDIALSVARNLAQILKSNSDYDVTLTRNHDETVSLSKRSHIAKKEAGDLFISIHLNSTLDLRAHGSEFYFQNQLPSEEESLFLANRENQAESEQNEEFENSKPRTGIQVIKEDLLKTYHLVMSREFAKSLRNLWKTDHGVNHSVIKQGPFHVISSVPMPSLLVELGFISHPKESRWLAQAETHQALAKSLFKGIEAVKEKMDKLGQKSHISAHAN